jgi:hypothetical protein
VELLLSWPGLVLDDGILKMVAGVASSTDNFDWAILGLLSRKVEEAKAVVAGERENSELGKAVLKWDGSGVPSPERDPADDLVEKHVDW